MTEAAAAGIALAAVVYVLWPLIRPPANRP